MGHVGVSSAELVNSRLPPLATLLTITLTQWRLNPSVTRNPMILFKRSKFAEDGVASLKKQSSTDP